METVVIEKVGDGTLPCKAHMGDAAFDVFTKEDYEVEANHRYKIPLGFRMQIPPGYAFVNQPRSGMSLKGLPAVMECRRKNDGFTRDQDGLVRTREIRLDADVNIGLIDHNYTGEVNALVSVHQAYLYPTIYKTYIPKGTKIAQIRFVHVPDVRMVQGEVRDNTERGDNGFGSTGEK